MYLVAKNKVEPNTNLEGHILSFFFFFSFLKQLETTPLLIKTIKINAISMWVCIYISMVLRNNYLKVWSLDGRL